MTDIVLNIASAFSISVFELGVLVAFVVIALIVTMGINAMTKTEAFKQLSMFLPILDSAITSLIRQVAENDSVVDWESERAIEMGIDPRMLYVLERLEVYTKKRGVKLELDFLYLRAQDIFEDLVDNGKI